MSHRSLPLLQAAILWAGDHFRLNDPVSKDVKAAGS